MITYFISYSHVEKGTALFGNVDVTVSKEIETIKDIRKLEKDVGDKHGLSQMVIINWRRFE